MDSYSIRLSNKTGEFLKSILGRIRLNNADPSQIRDICRDLLILLEELMKDYDEKKINEIKELNHLKDQVITLKDFCQNNIGVYTDRKEFSTLIKSKDFDKIHFPNCLEWKPY